MTACLTHPYERARLPVIGPLLSPHLSPALVLLIIVQCAAKPTKPPSVKTCTPPTAGTPMQPYLLWGHVLMT
jgi:hypothetical protein